MEYARSKYMTETLLLKIKLPAVWLSFICLNQKGFGHLHYPELSQQKKKLSVTFYFSTVSWRIDLKMNIFTVNFEQI